MYQSKNPYMYGTGRRKSSVARVHLFPNGTGSITINGRVRHIAKAELFTTVICKHNALIFCRKL